MDGTLVIATATGGGDPDLDGYALMVDGRNATPLAPNATLEIALPPGQHTLQLLGVVAHCSVTPGTSLQVDVPSQERISVAFDISCPGAAALITTTTIGLDLDYNGYVVEVNGTDLGRVPVSGTLLAHLDPGTWTVTLTDLTPNCVADGPLSRSVTVADQAIDPLPFSVICTATTGVISVVVNASGPDVPWAFSGKLDTGQFQVLAGFPADLQVSPGDHVVSLPAPPSNCSVQPDSVSVTVVKAVLIRDTVEAGFSVTCILGSSPTGEVRITTPVTGSLPSAARFQVWYTHFDLWDYFGPLILLDTIDPNGTLVATVPATGSSDVYWYDFWLESVPGNCTVQKRPDKGQAPGFTLMAGETLEVEFAVSC